MDASMIHRQAYLDKMAPNALGGFLSRNSTASLRTKPKASHPPPKEAISGPIGGDTREHSRLSMPKEAMIYKAFDTDAESIGDTTSHSVEKHSNVMNLVNVKKELHTTTRPELLKSVTITDFGRSSRDTSNAPAPPTTDKEDEDSSGYYADSHGENQGGLKFLADEEQAEWERYDVEEGFSSSKVVNLPQRNSSIPLVAQAITSPARVPVAVREKPLPAEPPRRAPKPVITIPKTTKKDFSSSKDAQISIPSRVPSQDRLSPATPTQQSSKRTPDYSTKQLARMSYTDLAKESFDHFPGSTIERLLPVTISSQPLEERFEYLVNLSGTVSENAKASLRATYLASLPLADFERCGQWLAQNIEANTELQSTLRQRKRAAAQAFENELMERMALIKKHKGRVDKDLRRLKVAGSNMVAGKAVKGSFKGVSTTGNGGKLAEKKIGGAGRRKTAA